MDVKNQFVRYELFSSSDIADLVNALLSPCPEIRAALEYENGDGENSIDGDNEGDVQ